jgi:hypothetical protein
MGEILPILISDSHSFCNSLSLVSLSCNSLASFSFLALYSLIIDKLPISAKSRSSSSKSSSSSLSASESLLSLACSSFKILYSSWILTPFLSHILARVSILRESISFSLEISHLSNSASSS